MRSLREIFVAFVEGLPKACSLKDDAGVAVAFKAATGQALDLKHPSSDRRKAMPRVVRVGTSATGDRRSLVEGSVQGYTKLQHTFAADGTVKSVTLASFQTPI